MNSIKAHRAGRSTKGNRKMSPTITTKSQTKTRATTPPAEEMSQSSSLQGETSGSGQPSQSGSPLLSQEASGTWSLEDDGSYSGPGGAKHWGERHPKVAVASRAEAEELIRQVDNTAKISGLTVRSERDTIDTYIVAVGTRVIISGPLAVPVSQARGLDLLTAGDGNPPVAKQEEPVDPAKETKT